MAKPTSSIFSYIAPANKLFMTILPAVGLMVAFVFIAAIPSNFFLLKLINIVISFTTIGLSLCFPVIIEYRQKHKSLPLSYLYEIVGSTTKKSAPGIFGVFMLIILAVFFITIVLSLTVFKNTSLENNQILTWGTSPTGTIVVAGVMGIIQGLLITVPIFYSFKKKGLLRSIGQSISYSFSHLSLTFFVVGVQILAFLLFNVPRMVGFSPLFLTSILNAVIDIWLTCVAYLYYKNNEV